MGMRKILLLIFTVCIWLLATQHCVIAEALSQTAKTSEHHHCSHDKESNKSPRHEGECQKKQCCQPISKLSEAGNIEKFSELIPVWNVAIVSWISGNLGSLEQSALYLPPTHAPPISKERTFILSSLLAPNAPPYLA